MFEESKTAIYFIGFYRKSKLIVGNLVKNSRMADLLSEIKLSFFRRTVKSASILIFTAVLVNILLSVALRKEITPLDLIIKGAVLFLSLGGFFCNADWEAVKKSSALLSKIFK